MSGPEHYAEAERLIALAQIGSNDERDPIILAAAHTHATLALAAATAESLPRAVLRETEWELAMFS